MKFNEIYEIDYNRGLMRWLHDVGSELINKRPDIVSSCIELHYVATEPCLVHTELHELFYIPACLAPRTVHQVFLNSMDASSNVNGVGTSTG